MTCRFVDFSCRFSFFHVRLRIYPTMESFPTCLATGLADGGYLLIAGRPSISRLSILPSCLLELLFYGSRVPPLSAAVIGTLSFLAL